MQRDETPLFFIALGAIKLITSFALLGWIGAQLLVDGNTAGRLIGCLLTAYLCWGIWRMIVRPFAKHFVNPG
jgi:hypothetical protein